MHPKLALRQVSCNGGYSENHPVDTRLGERLSMYGLSHISQLSTKLDEEPRNGTFDTYPMKVSWYILSSTAREMSHREVRQEGKSNECAETSAGTSTTKDAMAHHLNDSRDHFARGEHLHSCHWSWR